MYVNELIWKYWDGLLGGVIVNVRMAVFVWVFGMIAGLATAVGSVRYPNTVGVVGRALAFLLGAIPLIALLFALHYPVQSLFRITVNPEITCVLALATVNTFLVFEIIRPVLVAFPAELTTSALVYGVSPGRCFIFIKLPLIVRQVIPSLLITQVTMLQSTIFGAFIGVPEIFRVAQRITSIEQVPVTAYWSVALFFICISLPVTVLASYLQKRFGRNLSER